MGESTDQRVLLRETLPLLASYSWDQKVILENSILGVNETEDDLSVSRFAREFRLRHAVATASLLPKIIENIEINPSHESRLERSESIGVIAGRLDLPRYLARRANVRTGPRRFPIIRSRWSYDTPENNLANMSLIETHAAMRDNPFPKKSVESLVATKLLHWSTNRLVRRPWDEVVTTGLRDRLYNEVVTRVRRRQTGNDFSYQNLLDWFDEWTLNLKRLGNEKINSIIEGLLAFPSGESFWEKVFEVWCLQTVVSTLASLGWKCIAGPAPLHRRSGPIYKYITPRGESAAVYFQKQMNSPSHWKYRDGNELRGIPDIIIVKEDNFSTLLIDAKYRFTTTQSGFTKSEEIYKMLGYAENFQLSKPPSKFSGILIFPTDQSAFRILDGPGGGRINLIAINLVGDRTIAMDALAIAIDNWEIES